MARIRFRERAGPASFPGRARVDWPDGTRRTGWLRTGDAGAFTAVAAAEVAARLRRGEGRAGGHFPGELFGTDLAVAAGRQLLLDDAAP